MKRAVVIDNPVINSPFAEPRRHYRFDDDGITNDIICDRRPSSYFIPIARPRKKAKDVQQTFEDWTADRIEENQNVSGLEAVKRKIGVKVVYDLSATPFFLRGSRYSEGTLFPWVVSDCSLIDAIESGNVKVPRVPVSDNAMDGLAPTYRDLWVRNPKPPGPPPTHVRALEERIACEITFPRIDGCRYELPAERLRAKFTEKSQLALSTRDVPTPHARREATGRIVTRRSNPSMLSPIRHRSVT